SALALFNAKDPQVSKYNKDEIMKLLRIPECHSSEESEIDQKNNEEKCQIVVYDYFWCSNEFKNLLRNLFKKHALLQQSAQLMRPQIYDDIHFCKNISPPKNALTTDGYDRLLDYRTEEEHMYSESSTTDINNYDDIPQYFTDDEDV
ncbi:1560_t:CDS:2, partial [Funneliformis caledonium]